MSKFPITVAFTIAAAAMAASSASFAGDAKNLKEWAAEAGQSVNDVMRYPAMAFRGSGEGVSTFRVTVDRNGDVVESKRTNSRGDGILRGAATRVVANADFPDLPAGFDDDTLTFVLRVEYGLSGSDGKRNRKTGTVTSRRIASNDATTYAALRIVANGE
jgi:TonB family protein